MTTTAERDWLGGAIATCGGSALVAGALLPWLSLFAGLHRYAGVAGLNGRVLLVGGALAVAGGLAMFARPRRRLRPLLGALGVALAAFAAWVIVGLRETVHALAHHPLLLARPGSGLYVALAGALLMTVLFVPLPRQSVALPERSGEGREREDF